MDLSKRQMGAMWLEKHPKKTLIASSTTNEQFSTKIHQADNTVIEL
jgi:hypothetical protein